MRHRPSSPPRWGGRVAARYATCLLVGLLILPPVAAFADSKQDVPVHIGTHEGYGRVVFYLPPGTDYNLTQQGQHVVVHFAGDLTVGASQGVPRNVVSITGGVHQAELVVAPGTALHNWRLGDLVVIDVMDHDTAPASQAQQGTVASKSPAAKPAPSTSSATAPAAAPPPAQSSAAKTEPPPPAQPKAEAANQQPEPVSPGAAPPQTVPQESPPVLAAQPSPPATAAGAAEQSTPSVDSELVVPTDSQVGVAVFRRGFAALIVFDRPSTIDATSLRDDPVFGTVSVQTLPTATLIRVQLDAATALSTSRIADAWHISAVAREPTLHPIQATVADDRLVLLAAAPGNVVSVVDPDSGATLLVGTQRREGQGVPVPHNSPEFTLLPTWQGVVVVPNADTVTLRPTAQGFVIAGALALSPPSDIPDQLARSIGLTRQFDFPSQPNEVLLQRLQRQIVEDASSPPLARGPRRQAVARTMIALGLGVEAAAMLHIAATDDPHEADSPDNGALSSIAALLAHRPDETDGLVDPRLPPADDIELWRAVRLAQLQDGSAPAAAMFAATLPLVLAYPPEVRDRILPLAAETLVAGCEITTAQALLQARKDDATLDLARAMLQEAQGDSAGALTSYDKLAQSRDQSVHARAAVSAVELRLASGALDAKQAADQLESLLYSWRGDKRERALRERLAGLEARVGAWRSGLALLRDSESLFPDNKAAIHGELGDMFAGLLRGDVADTLPPLELVSVVEENADLLPAGPDGEALQAKLADRLVALDLPKRAGPLLEKLMQAAQSGTVRAGFGARLAALRLREGDAAGALGALDASVAEDLSPDLIERRTLLVAAANARRGDNDRALAALGTLDSAAAYEARATILERANDWPAAQRALTDYAAKTVPLDGKLDDPQRRTLLRLATATARAGDNPALTALRQREGARMETGPLADMFRLLTADPVRGVADLKRSGQEANLARELPGELKTLQPPVSANPVMPGSQQTK
jgi:hypothetical protein